MDYARVEEGSLRSVSRTTSSSGTSLWQQQSGGNVKVIVRVKPEYGAAAQGVLQIRGNNIKVLVPKQLDFDGFSWVAGPQSTQNDLMARVGEPTVENLRNGFNSTILAYGDSGSGKTHTMIGPPGNTCDAQDGLIPRVLKSLFSQLTADYGPATTDGAAASSCAPSARTSETEDTTGTEDCSSSCDMADSRVTWSAEMAFLQVYKTAEITNLLSTGYAESTLGGNGQRRMRLAPILDPGQAKLPKEVMPFLRRKGAMVAVTTAEEALARLQQGARLRCTSATVNNADSSRSHAVFVLELTIRTPRPDGSWVEQCPRLVMMDLAGSESFDSSSNTAETIAINSGLLWLGNVLRDLADVAEKGATGGGKNGGCVANFNNHNLTRFLEHSMDSKGRGGKLALIVTVRPTPPDRLHHSLWFAKKALSIKITATKNEHLHARDMAKLVEKLEARVDELEVELQRWWDRTSDAVDAACRDIAKQYDDRAAATEARHEAEASVLRRRGDDAVRALEQERQALRRAEGTVEELMPALAAAREEAARAADAAAVLERSDRQHAEEAVELRQRLQRAETAVAETAAAAAAAGRRHEQEVCTLREELQQAWELRAKDAAAAAQAAAEAAEHDARVRREAEEAHAAQVRRLEEERQGEARAAQDAAAQAAAAHARAMADAKAEAAARLQEQEARLAAQHAERLASVEAAAAAAAAAAAEAHKEEVQQLLAELATARGMAAAAEQRMTVQSAEAAAAAADYKRQLDQTKSALDAARRDLRALRQDSALRRESLLRAKAVVQEVREDEVARVSGHGLVQGHRQGAQQQQPCVHASQGSVGRRGASVRASLASDHNGGGHHDSDGRVDDAHGADGRLEDARTPRGWGVDEYADDGQDGSLGDQTRGTGTPISMSPVQWLRQAVNSPESIRSQTPAEKARMLRHVISHMKWEAAGIISEQHSSSDDGLLGGDTGGGTGGSGRGRDAADDGENSGSEVYDGAEGSVGQRVAGTAAEGVRRLFAAAAVSGEEEGGGSGSASDSDEALLAFAVLRRGSLSPVGRDQQEVPGSLNAATNPVAAAAAAANQKRRRQLQPPQPDVRISSRPSSRQAAAERWGAERLHQSDSGPVLQRASSLDEWPDEYAPEASCKDSKAALDSAVLDDMRARQRQLQGVQLPGPEKVTVDLLVSCLQGKRLNGVEWRRVQLGKGKKRHELIQDYLAWAAAHPPAAVKRDASDAGDAGACGRVSSCSGNSAAGSGGDGLQVCGSPNTHAAQPVQQLLHRRMVGPIDEDLWATVHVAAAGGAEKEGESRGGPARLSSSISQSLQTPCARGQQGDLIDGQQQQYGKQQQPGRQQQQVPPPSPAMALLADYADTPPPTKLLAKHRQQRGGPSHSIEMVSVYPGQVLAGPGHAQALGYNGVALDDIFSQGSQRFCEGQLPRNGRRF